MIIIKTNFRTLNLEPNKIKLTNRGCSGISIRNMFKFKKDEYIIAITYSNMR